MDAQCRLGLHQYKGLVVVATRASERVTKTCEPHEPQQSFRATCRAIHLSTHLPIYTPTSYICRPLWGRYPEALFYRPHFHAQHCSKPFPVSIDTHMYIHAYKYVYIRVHTHIHIRIQKVYIYIYKTRYIYIYVYLYTCIHVYMYIRIHVYMCICIYAYVYIWCIFDV